MEKINRINLHISNMEMCNAMLDTVEAFIENVMENLDDVSKYSFASNLLARLDDLTQTCYDTADDSAQAIIDYMDNTGWDYSLLEGYRKYSIMMSDYLHDVESEVDESEDEVDDVEGVDVVKEFGIRPSYAQELMIGRTNKLNEGQQLRFPDDYEDEEALAKGVTKPPVQATQPTADTKADERKKARAAYLAAMKQKNTTQPT